MRNTLLNSQNNKIISNYLISRNHLEWDGFSVEQTDSKEYRNINDILRYTILHWICPIALDIQEDGNEEAAEPMDSTPVDTIITDELSVIIDLDYFVTNRFMMKFYNLCLKKYQINPKNIFFTGPKAVYQKGKIGALNIDTSKITTTRRLYISQQLNPYHLSRDSVKCLSTCGKDDYHHQVTIYNLQNIYSSTRHHRDGDCGFVTGLAISVQSSDTGWFQQVYRGKSPESTLCADNSEP